MPFYLEIYYPGLPEPTEITLDPSSKPFVVFDNDQPSVEAQNGQDGATFAGTAYLVDRSDKRTYVIGLETASNVVLRGEKPKISKSNLLHVVRNSEELEIDVWSRPDQPGIRLVGFHKVRRKQNRVYVSPMPAIRA